jgi:acyl carrier protein
LPVLYHYQHGIKIETSREEPVVRSSQKIIETLQREIFQPIIKIELNRIETAETFSELGLDSIQYVRISRGIEETFKIQFSPVMLFKHSSFEKLAQYLSTQVTEEPIQTKPQLEDMVNPPIGNDKDIAIIGVSCRFPGGAIDLESFWQNLAGQKDGITTIAEGRPNLIIGGKITMIPNRVSPNGVDLSTVSPNSTPPFLIYPQSKQKAWIRNSEKSWNLPGVSSKIAGTTLLPCPARTLDCSLEFITMTMRN